MVPREDENELKPWMFAVMFVVSSIAFLTANSACKAAVARGLHRDDDFRTCLTIGAGVLVAGLLLRGVPGAPFWGPLHFLTVLGFGGWMAYLLIGVWRGREHPLYTLLYLLALFLGLGLADALLWVYRSVR